MSIAKMDRNACCGQDFSGARRFAALSCFEPSTCDGFVSLRQMPTVTRGRPLSRTYPRSCASSQPMTVTERYDAYTARSQTPWASVGAELASVELREQDNFSTCKQRSGSLRPQRESGRCLRSLPLLRTRGCRRPSKASRPCRKIPPRGRRRGGRGGSRR